MSPDAIDALLCPDLTVALCAAIVALLSDAVIALRADHFDGAEERIEQAHAVLLMASEAAGGGQALELVRRANRLIEAVAHAGMVCLVDLDDQEAEIALMLMEATDNNIPLEY